MVLLEGFLAAQELSVAEGRSPGVEGLHSFSCVRAGGWEVGCGSWQQVEGEWSGPSQPLPWPRWPPAQRTQPSSLHVVLPLPPASRRNTGDKLASGLWCPTPVPILQ